MRLSNPGQNRVDLLRAPDAAMQRILLFAAVGAGATNAADSAAVPAGKRWYVVNAGVNAQFQGAPVAGDDGAVAIGMHDGVLFHPLHGATFNGALGTGSVYSAAIQQAVLKAGEVLRVYGDALGSAAALNALGFAFILEYDAP